MTPEDIEALLEDLITMKLELSSLYRRRELMETKLRRMACGVGGSVGRSTTPAPTPERRPAAHGSASRSSETADLGPVLLTTADGKERRERESVFVVERGSALVCRGADGPELDFGGSRILVRDLLPGVIFSTRLALEFHMRQNWEALPRVERSRRVIEVLRRAALPMRHRDIADAIGRTGYYPTDLTQVLVKLRDSGLVSSISFETESRFGWMLRKDEGGAP